MAVDIEIKFCGLTRVEDAHAAGALGASFVGAIFAGGPRQLTPERAAEVLDGAGEAVQRVGVFAAADPPFIAHVARTARLDIAQLHGDPTADDVRTVRDQAGVRVWAVIRVAVGGERNSGHDVWKRIEALEDAADGIVLDAYVPGQLGGTGVAFDWSTAARSARRPRTRLVVAGGLNPVNVGAAIAALRPNVVDVSSGVERERGVKDHERMRAFVAAVRHSEGRE
ncbi:MAG TPA: phosphoribosylanthranilate isomerase [Gemmatimonadaceae bacterium]|nr:phosphoribosylanthranilate isomerase [Gemmatimonadaceae bacterium]